MSRQSLGTLILLLLVSSVTSGVWEYCTTWTNVQKQHNPAGYISSLIQKMESDIRNLAPLRNRVQHELTLVIEEQQRIAGRDHEAASLAVELREKLSAGTTRVLVRGRVLTPDQIESQISSLLAEIESGELAVSHLQGVREALEVQLEHLTTQQTEGAAGLRMLEAQRQLVLSRQVGSLSLDELSSQVNELLASSREVQVSASRGLSARGLDSLVSLTEH
jgi:hypothetical protein